MFIEIKFNCSVANSGYEFDEHGMVRPKDTSRGFNQIPLDEIAVFEFIDLFEYLDGEYKAGCHHVLSKLRYCVFIITGVS